MVYIHFCKEAGLAGIREAGPNSSTYVALIVAKQAFQYQNPGPPANLGAKFCRVAPATTPARFGVPDGELSAYSDGIRTVTTLDTPVPRCPFALS